MPEWLDKLREWGVPEDTHYYLITRGWYRQQDAVHNDIFSTKTFTGPSSSRHEDSPSV